MPETRVVSSRKREAWPDSTTARLFLNQMANGDGLASALPDLVRLSDWLKQMELGAFAYIAFKDRSDPVAQTITRQLETAYWAQVAAASIKVTALEQILDRLAAHHVDCTLMKGAAFGATIYSEQAVRPMNDIDLWIQKKDLPVVWQLFKEMGYQEDGKPPDFDSIPDYISELSFYPDAPHLSKWNVEVHWDLLPRPGLMGRLPQDVWWQRRRRVAFQGREVMVLAPADALVHACTHQLLQHREQIRWRWLLDIDRLIRGRGAYVIAPADWQRLAAEFGDSELWPVIQAGMQLAAHWFATPLPEPVQALFAQLLSVDQQLFYLFYAIPNMTIGERMIVQLQGTNGWQYRAQMMLAFLFPPPKYMMERYEISNRLLLPFYYSKRLFQGMKSYVRGR